MRKDIDWYAVNTVCSERIPMRHLKSDEKRMVVRRLIEKMRRTSETNDRSMTAEFVANLLGTTTRSIERYIAELPAADKRTCPVCREDMWVIGSEVEPHPTRLLEECPMSYSHTRRGLASIRPDLYQWASDEAVSA